MPTLGIALLVAVTVVTVAVLAIVVVVVVDRVRATVDHVTTIRDEVLPAVEQLRTDVDAARRRAERLQGTRLRLPPGGEAR